MPNLKPYDGPTKLLVAFDIGTTYSGIAYCFLQRGEVPQIIGVTKFPGQGKTGGDAKVPSVLYYDRSGVVRAAGADTVAERFIEKAQIDGWTKAEWWKLHLRPKHLASAIDMEHDLPPLPSGKSAPDVLVDFIKYLCHCAKIFIQERHCSFDWSSTKDSVEYIFTHPNGWEDAQQKIYRQAIVRAGLVPGTPGGQSRVHMLTEGEASLHFCVTNLLNAEATKHVVPRGVVIIDAGGGTVDLSMFSMTANPVSCEEIAPAECQLQGAVFVTRRARDLLQRKLAGWEHSTIEDIAEITREFDQSTKLAIKSDQEPAYIKVARYRYCNLDYNIVNGKLRLSGDEATELFEDSINTIIKAFEQQLKYAKTQITTAFLVGGFSANDWLWSCLQSYFKAKNIDVWRPDSYINKAVANGAVLSYIDRDNHLVSARVARSTLGVVCAIPAKASDREHVRRKQKWETDPSGIQYVPGYFESKVHKGDHIDKEIEFRESYSRMESNPEDFRTQTVRFECYRGNLSDPKWVDQDRSSFFTYCTVRADLRNVVGGLVKKKRLSGQVYYQLDYEVIVYFGLTELKAFLGWMTKDGEQRIPMTITYET